MSNNTDGVIFNIEEMTAHDGDGMRLTIFMKGCPLRCEWCHNPEGQRKEPELLYKKNKCIKCGLCMRGCNHKDCIPFGRCLHICPNECLSICGEIYTVEQLANKINGYKKVFDLCGGGVTFSGGEPLYQYKFLSEVLDGLNGVNTAIETSGYAPESVFREIVDKVDLVYMDIKLYDGEEHRKYTGVDNSVIKQNFKYLQNSKKRYIIRTPLIVGKTDGTENLLSIKKFIGDSEWEKLPENKLAEAKKSFITGIVRK